MTDQAKKRERSRELVVASGNRKKLAELVELLSPSGVIILSPEDVGGLPDVEENLPTFTGNARKKAVSAALVCARWTLADDSGLVVDYLNGEPGVHSARFAGTHGDDEANNRLLLERLRGVPEEQRSARFICALSLCDGRGRPVLEITGEVQGSILESPSGEGGFGYDPLFKFTEPGFPQTGRCFGTLSPHEKAEVSHRGRALRKLIEGLESLAPTKDAGAKAESASS